MASTGFQSEHATIEWARENLKAINEGSFEVIDAGPLHAPVRGLALSRKADLSLILETWAGADAVSSSPDRQSGTLRRNDDKVELANPAGMKVRLAGVQPFRMQSTINRRGQAGDRTETSKIHEITAVLEGGTEPSCVVDWLENLPNSPFVWPDVLRATTHETTTLAFAAGAGELAVNLESQRRSSTRCAATVVVEGVTVHVCALPRDGQGVFKKPGCLIFLGSPDEAFRKKVRNALSLALGVYLVDTGSSGYSAEWRLLRFTLKDAYSIDGKALELPVLPPAPIGNRWQNEIDNAQLTRAVQAYVRNYDALNIGELHWAYWHAECATVHIAAAHFGAAIELLQRRYLASSGTDIATKHVPDRAAWKRLREAIHSIICNSDVSEASKEGLLANVGGLNRVHQRTIMEHLLSKLNLPLGSDEDGAWTRRNDAAHGLEMREGDELQLIRDTGLLKTTFHRLLLRVTEAADHYVDYSTPGFPRRALSEPVPSSRITT